MTKRELRELIRSVITEYTGKGAPYGGAEGQQTRGMEPIQGTGNPTYQKQVKF